MVRAFVEVLVPDYLPDDFKGTVDVTEEGTIRVTPEAAAPEAATPEAAPEAADSPESTPENPPAA